MKDQILNRSMSNIKQVDPLLGIYIARRIQQHLTKTKPSSVKKRASKFNTEAQSRITNVFFK